MAGFETANGVITPIPELELASANTAIVDFAALYHLPSALGAKAHERLGELFGRPLATSDRDPGESDSATGQLPGQPLGELVGREKVFVQNLPAINATLDEAAETHGVDRVTIEDALVTILRDSGIGHSMARTLERPLGDMKGLFDHLEEHVADNGLVILMREPIANWGDKRHAKMMSIIGGMSSKMQHSLLGIVHAGSGRVFGATEMWRPEYASLEGPVTEARAASDVHIPRTRDFLQDLGLDPSIAKDVVALEGTKVSGDDLIRRVVELHGDIMRNAIVLEIGNAPAGYIQVMGSLTLAEAMPGFDPNVQSVMTHESVDVVSPRAFNALSAYERSRVQNAGTGLNSLNGMLSAIVATNVYQLRRRQIREQ
jgi:hypothetical protein